MPEVLPENEDAVDNEYGETEPESEGKEEPEDETIQFIDEEEENLAEKVRSLEKKIQGGSTQKTKEKSIYSMDTEDLEDEIDRLESEIDKAYDDEKPQKEIARLERKLGRVENRLRDKSRESMDSAIRRAEHKNKVLQETSEYFESIGIKGVSQNSRKLAKAYENALKISDNPTINEVKTLLIMKDSQLSDYIESGKAATYYAKYRKEVDRDNSMETKSPNGKRKAAEARILTAVTQFSNTAFRDNSSPIEGSAILTEANVKGTRKEVMPTTIKTAILLTGAVSLSLVIICH